MAGAEALVRWQHPTRGLLYPDAFIADAETTGTVLTLGAHVLAVACGQLRRWGAMGIACPSIAVNLSGRQLHDSSIVATFEAVLAASGLAPERLTVEVTESTTIGGVVDVAERLNSLKELGLAIAVDDFGTGFSSLSYLRELPIDIVKLDRTFTAEVGYDRGAATLLEAIVDLAHAIGLRTIVEGVETTEQLQVVRRTGTDEVQGYLLARPAPSEATEKLLRANAALVHA